MGRIPFRSLKRMTGYSLSEIIQRIREEMRVIDTRIYTPKVLDVQDGSFTLKG